MKIVQLTPGLHVSEELDPTETFEVRPWMSASALAAVASDGGHELVTVHEPTYSYVQLAELVADADLVVIAPQSNPQPQDELRVRLLARSLVAAVTRTTTNAHIVLVSHFLVGHGRNHPNAKPGTWGLAEFEREVRISGASWSIVRPTWLSLEEDTQAYTVFASQSALADGLVSAHGLATTIVASANERHEARGTTFAIYSAPPAPGEQPSVPDFARLRKDYEALSEPVLA